MIVEIVRLLVTLAATALGFEAGDALREWLPGEVSLDVARVVGAVLGAGIGYVIGGVFGRTIRTGLNMAPQAIAPRWSGPQLFAGAFGVLAGVLIGAVAAVPLVVFLPPAVGWPLAGLVVVLLAAFGGQVFAGRADDLLVMAGLRTRGPILSRHLDTDVPVFLLDSAAAIDGRVLELTRSGLVRGRIWVPGFVVDELQGLADSADRSRRRRGRRGLDVIEALRDVPGVDVVVLEDTVPEHPEVDAKLVALGSRADATMITTDHNLARAAGVRGIAVLNPHELGESLRPAHTAGDRLKVAVTKQGSEPGQGVGYLDDGTMVVIEQGSDLVGSEVEVEITSSVRTSIGRMVFGRPLP